MSALRASLACRDSRVPGAAECRQVLDKFNVDINDPSNEVYLPRTPNSSEPGAYHPRLHTPTYYAEVYRRRLSQATTRDEAIQIWTTLETSSGRTHFRIKLQYEIMKVFILKADANRYQGLLPSDRSNSLEVFQRFDGTSIATSWVPWKVEVARPEGYENLPMGDFPLMAFHVPAFNERATDLLRPLLMDNGELLPLLCDEGSYFAYNVTTVLDALDVEKSSVIRFTSGRIMHITRHEFLPEKVTSSIFKIPQVPRMRVFVTDEFQEAVSRHDLKGFDFQLAWDSSS